MIIANAPIWGVVLVSVSLALKGADRRERVQRIIGGGAVGSLLVVGGLSARRPGGAGKTRANLRFSPAFGTCAEPFGVAQDKPRPRLRKFALRASALLRRRMATARRESLRNAGEALRELQAPSVGPPLAASLTLVGGPNQTGSGCALLQSVRCRVANPSFVPGR